MFSKLKSNSIRIKLLLTSLLVIFFLIGLVSLKPLSQINLKQLIVDVGYLGLFAIVFAESGLFFGFFLPGDSLLFISGLLASQKIFSLPILIVILTVAAIAGVSVGYAFGKKVGERLFNREDSLFFHKDHLKRANEFYSKHGGKTIVLARFMPFIRTFAPIVAGMGEMKYSRFLFYNILGALLWVVGLTLLGFWLGNIVSDVDQYLLPIIALIVLVSILPGLIHFYRENKTFLKEKIERLVKRT